MSAPQTSTTWRGQLDLLAELADTVENHGLLLARLLDNE